MKKHYGKPFDTVHSEVRAGSPITNILQNRKKEHYHVLRDIAKITHTRSGLSEEFTGLNFEPTYIEWAKKD
jgi:hypothetical protein